jgi:tetratricopeptide (TPR) repeat protein
MSADYYLRIVEGRTQQISRMSAAFLEAKTLSDVQFAYFQSYLVVRFLIDTYGFDKLRATLVDLGNASEINAALARNFVPLEKLDADFAEYAKAAANTVAGPFDLRPPDERQLSIAIAQIDRRNFFGQLQRARSMMQASRWLEARLVLKNLTVDNFYLPGRENVYGLLARVCRELGDAAGEREALTVVVTHEGDALDAVTRLLELAEAADEADAAARWADHWITINPLAPTPWRALLNAREQLGDAPGAIIAGETLLKLDPPDRAAIHFRLARQLEKTNADEARRHVLLALEEAPRFRDAHALLATLPPSADVAAAGQQPGSATP